MVAVTGRKVLLATVLVLAGAQESGAADPRAAGLILKAAGTTPPALAYSEVPDKTTYTLGHEGKLTLIHYTTCKQVTIAGGTVTIGRQDVTLADGARREQESGGKCPAELRIKPVGVTAGLTLRKWTGAPLPPTLGCGLVGEQAGRIVAARVLEGDAVVAAVPAVDRVLVWPKDQPPLADGKDYELRLETASGSAFAAPFTSRTQAQTPCVVRVR